MLSNPLVRINFAIKLEHLETAKDRVDGCPCLPVYSGKSSPISKGSHSYTITF